MTRLDKLMYGTVTLAIVAVLSVGIYSVTLRAESPQTDVQATRAVIKPEPVRQTPLNAQTVYGLVNAERVKAGATPLVWDEQLASSAQAKADDMNADGYFDHVDPETGERGVSYIPKTGCRYYAETLSRTSGFNDNNAQVVIGWMNSKSHHDAMLDQKYTRTGVAINGDKVVQHFCSN